MGRYGYPVHFKVGLRIIYYRWASAEAAERTSHLLYMTWTMDQQNASSKRGACRLWSRLCNTWIALDGRDASTQVKLIDLELQGAGYI